MGALATQQYLCSQNQAVSVNQTNANNNNNNNTNTNTININTNSTITGNGGANSVCGGSSSSNSASSSIAAPLTPTAHHDDPLGIFDSSKRNLWLAANNYLTADAIAMASMQERAYLSQFPSPTIPPILTEKKPFLSSSSCRYPQEKMDFFSKYANISTETVGSNSGYSTTSAANSSNSTSLGNNSRQSSAAAIAGAASAAAIAAQYSSVAAEHQHNASSAAAAAAAIASSSSSSAAAIAAAAASLYGTHFSPVGYHHLPLPTYESAAAARTCALPSPTIYPPTPPPSAPWIHPWFIGDTF